MVAATAVVAALVASLLTAAAPARADLMHYTPATGVLFNDPLTSARTTIIDHLVKSINSVPKGQKIRVASWNLRSGRITQALMDAHHRGVSVRVIVDFDNANAENPNGNFDTLHKQLPVTKYKRPADLTSWAIRCHGSCRGQSGIAHTKMFVFSQVGRAHDVVMFGSANATDLAAGYQWNDLYTMVEKPGLVKKAEQIFDEASLDKPVAKPLQTFLTGPNTVSWYPWQGTQAATPKTDPVLDALNRVRCAGATGGTGIKGYTSIRIAMTAMHGDRGLAIGHRLRTMWDRGCNIRLVYTLLGIKTRNLFEERSGRGPLPMKQIVQDFDGDGVYDRYLHLKAMAISGVYNQDTHATVTWMGSSNWTALSLQSDEMGMLTTLERVRSRYAGWVDYLYLHPPKNPSADDGSGTSGTDAAVAARRFDVPESSLTRPQPSYRLAPRPYAQVQVD